MRKVGIKAAKNGFSQYVRLAERGETVEITDRGRVVAHLGPPAVDRTKTTKEERWTDLIRRGVVTPAKRPKGPLPPRRPVMSLERLLGELEDDREDRF
jgi:prevent-host-death family protein